MFIEYPDAFQGTTMYSLILVSVLTWQALVFAQIDETEVALVCEFEVSFPVYNYRLLFRLSLAQCCTGNAFLRFH